MTWKISTVFIKTTNSLDWGRLYSFVYCLLTNRLLPPILKIQTAFPLFLLIPANYTKLLFAAVIKNNKAAKFHLSMEFAIYSIRGSIVLRKFDWLLVKWKAVLNIDFKLQTQVEVVLTVKAPTDRNNPLFCAQRT